MEGGHVFIGNSTDIWINLAVPDVQGSIAHESLLAEFQRPDSPYYAQMTEAIAKGGLGDDTDYYADQLGDQFFRGAGQEVPAVLPYGPEPL